MCSCARRTYPTQWGCIRTAGKLIVLQSPCVSVMASCIPAAGGAQSVHSIGPTGMLPELCNVRRDNMLAAWSIVAEIVRIVVAAVVAGTVSYGVSVALKRREGCQEIKTLAEELRQAMATFRRWLEQETDAYIGRRTAITEELVAPGLLHSSARATRQALALISYLRSVRENWFSTVESAKGALLVRAGTTDLAEIDQALADACAELSEDQRQTRYDQQLDIRATLARVNDSSRSMTTVFDDCLRNHDIDGLLAPW